jgi:hypothetical protein
MKIMLGLILVILLARPIRAQQPNTSDGTFLLESCQLSLQAHENPNATQNKYEAWRDGVCVGVIEGVSATSPLVCPAENVTLGQEVRVVIKFLQEHPEKLHLRGSKLVQEALAQAFPCHK